MSSGLSPEEIYYRLSNGETQAEIARAEGVSRQYISQLAKKAGWENPFKTMAENIPWEVKPEFGDNTIYKNIRRHGIWQTTRRLSKADSAHLRAFLKRLELFNSVVDYDPAYPANPGYTNTPGFTYVPREPGDEDYIIRIKPGIKLTHTGRQIWKIPTELP